MGVSTIPLFLPLFRTTTCLTVPRKAYAKALRFVLPSRYTPYDCEKPPETLILNVAWLKIEGMEVMEL